MLSLSIEALEYKVKQSDTLPVARKNDWMQGCSKFNLSALWHNPDLHLAEPVLEDTTFEMAMRKREGTVHPEIILDMKQHIQLNISEPCIVHVKPVVSECVALISGGRSQQHHEVRSGESGRGREGGSDDNPVLRLSNTTGPQPTRSKPIGHCCLFDPQLATPASMQPHHWLDIPT